MITHLKADNFKGVPYLESSDLMRHHPQGIVFAADKPTVIVGPNGSGKSALMKTLALETLSYYTGESNFDKHLVDSHEGEPYWEEISKWRNEYQYLAGLDCGNDGAPALFYRPGHIPGDETSVANAMMCGYFAEAREYAALVDRKSSGQKSLALLQRVRDALCGDVSDISYRTVNWPYGLEKRDLGRDRHVMPWEAQAEALKARYSYGKAPADAVPVALLDEPEQSLDAMAEALLWKQIAASDPAAVQVIVATHSWYPILHPERFHIVEAVPGYLKRVREVIAGN